MTTAEGPHTKKEKRRKSPVEPAEIHLFSEAAQEVNSPDGGNSGASAGKAPNARPQREPEPPEAEEAPAHHPLASAMDLLVRHLTEGDSAIHARGRPWQEVFLEALGKAPILAVATRIAGISRRQALAARKADPAFARRWDDAVEDGIDAVEAAAFKSAVFGDERSTSRGGKGETPSVEYSHTMRTFYLKARRPEVFGDKSEKQGESPPLLTLPDFRKRVEEART